MDSEILNTASSFLSKSTKDSSDSEDISNFNENLFFEDVLKFEIIYDITFLLKKIKKYIMKKVQENKDKQTLNTNFNLFLIKDIKKINLKDYMKRLCNYLELESSSLILALIYIEKISEKGIFLNDYSKYKLLLISVIIAIKFNEDDFPTNTFFSKVGGILQEELNSLENVFLKEIEFNLFVKGEEFESFYFYLISEKNI